MYILTTISDLIQITPEDFEKPSIHALTDNINAKYANKIIQKIGLCICLYDILSSSEGLIGHGTGIVNVNVEFRLVVFRPFKGEILQGRIESSSEAGINRCFVWTTEEGTEYFFDNNETVRFRVEAETWHDALPQGPTRRDQDMEGEKREPLYCLVGSMQQGGLGPLLWWAGNEEPAADGAAADGADGEAVEEE
ncbi:DNA-directed RNA polymerase III complex subunit Rpc25 [Coniosporium apollinis]|uniref:DNA-directed RNA polymerase subunit n=1 Tax=Coniosporium apollinis TaxID=61459 RepID=A0ABQ9P7R0_9PEZI|nr:DNA-directed RNA polymerase III complex subunit Rpc25 [Coniosporium apollinis]